MKFIEVKHIINKKNGQINLNAPRKKLLIPKDIDLNKIKFRIGWTK